MARTCASCGRVQPANVFGSWFADRWYCGRMCQHDAGDRSACLGWNCGCTRYAKKRRLLRGHRAEMRIIMDFIDDRGLGRELDFTLAETGNDGFFLGSDSEMDESSDVEDPEARAIAEANALRASVADQRRFLEAVQGAMENRRLLTDLERTRMELEDLRAQKLGVDVRAL